MKTSRLRPWVLGAALFVMGVMVWLGMGLALVLFFPDAEWPKNLALVGFAIPLSIASWREYAQGRARRLGYLVAGWLLTGVLLGGALYLVLVVIGPPPQG